MPAPTPTRSRPNDRLGAVCGILGAAGNAAGVAALYQVPAAYRPGSLDAWAAQSADHPVASAASAVAFSLGLLFLAAWGRRLGDAQGDGWSRAGGRVLALGAVLNAAACTAPLVWSLHVSPACASLAACAPLGRALLGLALSLDALFNLLLGAGLLAIGWAGWRGGEPRALSALGMAAGLASLPVSLQFASDRAARLLALAGPLWLAFVLAASVRSWRGLRARAR